MSEYLIQDSTLTNIANSIRNKTGKADPILTENMATEIDSITGGGGSCHIKLKSSASSLALLFRGSIFPENSEVEFEYVKSTLTKGLNQLFEGCENAKKIKILATSLQDTVILASAFAYTIGNEILDLSALCVPNRLGDLRNMCLKNAQLKTVIGELDFSKATNISGAFEQCNSLENITFKAGTIKESINFLFSLKLTSESIQSIIDGLATVEAPQTLTLHPAVKAKLTPEQTQAITAKNWILA